MARYLLFSLWALISSFIIDVTCQSIPSQWPLHNDGLNSIVEWDHYSFIINGQRLFIFSGEFHYWRYPVPELWEDLIEKIKAAGFNAFSIYAHWGYHAPNSTSLDFSTGAHDFTPIFTLAKKHGLYVLFRPGPYVNAEANAGGFPLWITTGAYGSLRNNDTRYTAAWQPFFSEISKVTSPYLITNGGSVVLFQIENELGAQWTGNPANKVPNGAVDQYMQLLEQTARDNGINIPLTANMPNVNSLSWSKDYSNVTGNVDVVGLDSYPSCWSCNLQECTSVNGVYVPYQVVDYYDYFVKASITQPNFFPEFQGGSYNPWGGPQGGCPDNTGPDFANIFYRHNVGQRSTAMSLYMLYGGTSWGSFAAPVVATSYDYSAPVSENRVIADKYQETKLLALFLRTAKDLTVTNFIGNNTAYSTNSAILTTELRNPETNAGFYVTIHANSSSATLETFKLNVNTLAGLLTIPRYGNVITLNGHQSKIVTTDFSLGSHTLLYTTAEILSYSSLAGGNDIVVLWVPTGEAGEFSVKGAKSGRVESSAKGSTITFHAGHGELTVAFVQSAGITVLVFDSGLKVVILDRTAAYKFWAPSLGGAPEVTPQEVILVQGPYLVRSAVLDSDGCTIQLTGDVDNSTAVIVFAPKDITGIEWNGKALHTTKTSFGALVATLSAPPSSSVSLPPLTSWKAQDSFPERSRDYDDSGVAWVDANHASTPNPTKPATYPVLYVDEYGFHNGIHLWRGRFDGSPTGVNLTVQGGTAFGFSAFLNGDFIGSFLGTSSLEVGSLNATFTNATLYPTDNVLVVIQDNTGHDETSGALNPRGILKAALTGPTNITFTSWKLAGTAGGDSNIDPIRGVLAEGGLYAERLGWQLPGFDDSSWDDTTSPSTGKSGVGVTFYRTVVPLHIPNGLDVSLSFVLSAPAGSYLRAQLFVNGYQYGRFTPHIGNQIVFPVPTGILDYNGDNTIGLAVWAQTEAGAKLDIAWQVEYVHATSYQFGFDASYLRPGWSEERLPYS